MKTVSDCYAASPKRANTWGNYHRTDLSVTIGILYSDRPRLGLCQSIRSRILSAVIVYSTAMCPYCVRAKQLLQRKGIEYREIRVDLDPEQMQIMRKSSRRRSVPQIFIGAYHVGGYDDLSDLDMQGKLDDILQQNLI